MDKIKIAILSHSEYQSAQKEADALLRISGEFGESEKDRLKAITNKKARVASLCGLAALSALAEKKGNICRTANGKPYFEDESLGYFSVSHSGDVSVAACSDSVVGVDVERIDTARDHKRIADRFFTDSELEIFHNSAESAECFFEIWTKKEAYVKYLGGTFASLYSKDTNEVNFKSYLLECKDSGYVVTVCSLREAKTELNILSEDIKVNAV